jgi:hypothetical protein
MMAPGGGDEHHGAPIDEMQIAAMASLPEMEWRTAILRVMARLQRQVDENTDITADTQEALNRDVSQRVSEMYEIFETARAWFRFAGKVGAAGMWMIETGGKLAKPLFWIGAVGAASWAWWKTGTFTWPTWLPK